MSKHGCFTPWKEKRYHFYRRTGRAPEPVWTGAENFASNGIRSLDRIPAHIYHALVHNTDMRRLTAGILSEKCVIS